MDEGGFSVVLELERLRGAVNEGFATVNGRLEGSLQRTVQTESDIEKLENRVSALERRVWTAAGSAAIFSGGAVAGLLQVIGGR